jgi:hypothetical protein
MYIDLLMDNSFFVVVVARDGPTRTMQKYNDVAKYGQYKNMLPPFENSSNKQRRLDWHNHERVSSATNNKRNDDNAAKHRFLPSFLPRGSKMHHHQPQLHGSDHADVV